MPTIGTSSIDGDNSSIIEDGPLTTALMSDLASLTSDADPHDEYDGSHKTTICFNKSCPDYKVQRHGNVPCGCKRTSVKGAGDARIGYSHY